MEKNQEFISVINSLLLLVDYHSNLLTNVMSGDQVGIQHAVVSAAKAAAILNVPVVMSTNDNNGESFLRELADVFPGREIIRRNPYFVNALADQAVFSLVKRHHREKIIVAGLWTSDGFTETALGAIEKGYDVYGLTDAAGDTSRERHNYGIQRMLRAGVTPITWISLASEWMNGWAVPAASYADETTGKNYAMLSMLSRE